MNNAQLSEMARAGVTHERPPFADEWVEGAGLPWTGYFCLASGCILDELNSWGECPWCCEEVVRVWQV